MRHSVIPHRSAISATSERRRHPKRLLAVGILPALGLIAAACGSSGSTASSSSTTAKPAASSSTSSSAAHPVATTANNPKFGTILVNSTGMTLYTLTNGTTPVSCTGACLGVWPALTLPAGVSTATGGPGVSNLGTTTSNGVLQVTHMGQPLYTFSGDKAVGEANGDGISSFGGVWHVVKAGSNGGSASPTGSPASKSPSTTASGGSGY